MQPKLTLVAAGAVVRYVGEWRALEKESFRLGAEASRDLRPEMRPYATKAQTLVVELGLWTHGVGENAEEVVKWWARQ